MREETLATEDAGGEYTRGTYTRQIGDSRSRCILAHKDTAILQNLLNSLVERIVKGTEQAWLQSGCQWLMVVKLLWNVL